ncbi:hypothetical protein FE257_003926 [Aspergillus nanangensis]|uniref:Uncharacterized protein n=1 Tax=Aspergillus nanangensis TaxID=2582783 RepID=A0AAD4GW97_ASPNN|nr:hypothetical protein FE257_003926 [Aspergillus nanangensis]
MDLERQITIYETARACERGFDRLSILGDETYPSTEVKELRGRFGLWIAYLGVFASPKASLDVRLTMHPDLKDIVLELLDMVSRNIAAITDVIFSSIDKSRISDGEINPFRGHRELKSVGEAIDRLLIFAVRIRRGSRPMHHAINSGEQVAKSLCCLIVERRHRHAKRSLCDQIGASIYTRGISLQYLQRHNQKLAHRRHDDGSVGDEDMEAGVGSGQGDSEGKFKIPDSQSTKHNIPVPETSPSAISPSAVVRLKNLKTKPSRSLISKESAIRDSQDDPFQYPPKPQRQYTSKYTPCTLCSEPLETSMLTDARWRDHVDRDLEPYICISEECVDPLRFFHRKQDWMEHMASRHTKSWTQRVHTEMWYCVMLHDVPVEFDNMTKLLGHLQSDHAAQLTKSQIQGRARRNRAITPREPFVCPLCDAEPYDVKFAAAGSRSELFANHIGRHLKSLAFLSLSYVPDYFQDSYTVEISDDPYNLSDTSRSDGGKMYDGRSLIEIAHSTIPSFDDIPETIIDKDGTRRINEQVFSGAPTPLLQPEDWAYMPSQGLVTDFDVLRTGMKSDQDRLINHDRVGDNIDLGSKFRSQAPWNNIINTTLQELELHTRVLGPEHPDTIMTMANLAYTYWNQGLFQDAESLQRRELQLSSKILGPEHPYTLTSINNLACILWGRGRWQEAEIQLKQVVQLRQEKLGSTSPSTLTSMSNLASVRRSMGDWEKAGDQERHVFTWRAISPMHTSTLASRMSVAHALWNLGKWEAAEKIEKKVLHAQESLLCLNHPDTLITLNNLACTYQSQKRWEEAEILNERVTEASRAILGPDHHFTLTSMGNLALTYRNRGKLQEARKLEEDVLATQEKMLGLEHPDTLLTRWNLSHTLKRQRRLGDALNMLKDCIDSMIRQFGSNHPHTQAATKHLEKWTGLYESINHSSGSGHKRKRYVGSSPITAIKPFEFINT